MEALFLKVLNMSLSAAAVIAAVILARLLLRRAPKKWRYLLWCVVAFRLICPVSFSAPFSVLRLTAQPAVVAERESRLASEIAYIPEDIGLMAHPQIYVGTPAVSQAVSAALPEARPTDSANPLQIWTFIGAVLWCAGMAALLLYGIVSYLLLRRKLSGAIQLEDGLRETDAVRAPFILGLLRPRIYLPPGLTGETLRYVLAHERYHIRHLDHAVKLFGFLLLCVHWFNPLVWLAFALMNRDMEMRCDEAVLAAENGITKPYSMALLSFATARRFPSPSPLCFGETGVKERIRNVLRWKKPKAWVTVCAVLLCVVAVAACAANPEKGEKPTGTPWDWTSTVRLSDVKGFAEGNGLTLRYTQMQELIRLLNAVKPEEVVRGRGIPSDRTLDITTGVGYRLRWGGGVIELDFADNAAAAELYGSPATPGPGVWEIHNEALYAFLDGLEAAPAPASASDLDGADTLDWGPNLSPDGHMVVRRFDGDGWYIYIPVSGWTLEEASEARTRWSSDAGTGSTLVVRRASVEEYAADRPELEAGQSEKWVPAGDGSYWLVFTQYDPMLLIRSSWIGVEPGLLQRMADSFRIDGALPAETSGDSEEALRTMQREDPTRFTAQMEAWSAEVGMIGEQFISEAGEAGEWWDVRAAFADRWCEKYLHANADSPFACEQCGIWELGTWLDCISLTGSPRRLAFSAALSLIPRDEAAFAAFRTGWVNKTEDGRCVIQTEAVLRSDDGVHWTVEALNSGGSGGWGYRTRSSVNTQAEIEYALGDDDRYGIHLLRYLPNLDWTKLSAAQFNKVSERLRAAALKTDELDLGENDQLYRDLYMLWGFQNTDGAYAALFLDGEESIFAIQYRADPQTFLSALSEMDPATQRPVRQALGI